MALLPMDLRPLQCSTGGDNAICAFGHFWDKLTHSDNFPELRQHSLMEQGILISVSYLSKHFVLLLNPPQVTGCFASLYDFICKLLKQQLTIRSTPIKLIIASN